MEIRSKKEFFKKSAEGLLGNRIQIFKDAHEASQSPTGRVGFREVGKTGGGAWCRVSSRLASKTHSEWTQAGRTFVMDCGIPEGKVTLQGEVVRTTKGLEGFLCERREMERSILTDRIEYAPLLGRGVPPMRFTVKHGFHRTTSYLETRMLLAKYMDAASRDDLDMLLEQYPDAAIEFACFSVYVGVIPRRNSVIWEVRNY